MDVLELLLLIASVWRLSSLLANEDGPFHLFKTLRSRLARIEVKSRRRNGLISRLHLYEGVNCEFCNSVWFGGLLGVAYLVLGDAVMYVVLPLALSTGAIIVKRIVNTLGSIDTYYDKLHNGNLNHSQAVERLPYGIGEPKTILLKGGNGK